MRFDGITGIPAQDEVSQAATISAAMKRRLRGCRAAATRVNAAVVGVTLAIGLGACSNAATSDPASDPVGRPATISHIHGLGIDPSGVVYVATHFGLVKQGAGGGWVGASADTNDHMGFSLHPLDGVMYRSGHSRSKPSLGVQASRDGATWEHRSDVAEPPVDFHSMAVSFADPRSLWGRDAGGRGTFRSTDGGITWSSLATAGVAGQIYVLAGPAERGVVVAGTDVGLFRSTDGGATWRRIGGLGSGWVLGVGPDPKDPQRMFVSSASGMKATYDGGATWRDAGTGLPLGAEIASIAVSPVDPLTVFAADASKIYRTIDGGSSWTAVATG